MSRIAKVVLVSAAVAAALGTGSAQANPVCVQDTPADPVYEGCTWIDPSQPCVYSGGTILGDPYRLICP
jgi:hypothetical protein